MKLNGKWSERKKVLKIRVGRNVGFKSSNRTSMSLNHVVMVIIVGLIIKKAGKVWVISKNSFCIIFDVLRRLEEEKNKELFGKIKRWYNLSEVKWFHEYKLF